MLRLVSLAHRGPRAEALDLTRQIRVPGTEPPRRTPQLGEQSAEALRMTLNSTWRRRRRAVCRDAVPRSAIWCVSGTAVPDAGELRPLPAPPHEKPAVCEESLRSRDGARTFSSLVKEESFPLLLSQTQLHSLASSDTEQEDPCSSPTGKGP